MKMQCPMQKCHQEFPDSDKHIKTDRAHLSTGHCETAQVACMKPALFIRLYLHLFLRFSMSLHGFLVYYLFPDSCEFTK